MIAKIATFLLLLLASTRHASFGQEKDAAGFFNVKNYGATGNGKTLDTRAIDRAIAACVKSGGGTVYFPPGSFLTGSFQLFSNIHLELGPGAVILASLNKQDYFFQKDYGFSGSGAGDRIGLIFASHAENISITGQGAIDGRGTDFMYMDSLQYGMDFNPAYTRQGNLYMNPAYGRADGPVLWKGTYQDRPGTEIIFASCTHVTVSGITVREAANWSVHFLECGDVKVRGISVRNNMNIPNSDGLDVYDSHNVIISDCNIRSGDDAIALISSRNVTVTNCNLSSRSCGIRIGYNVYNDRPSENLLFDNICIDSTNRGIGIFQRREGDMTHMLFSNIIIRTRLHSGQWWGHGEPIHISALPGLGSRKVGEISDVRFSNIMATGEEGIVLYGSKGSMLKNISFDHIQLHLRKGPLTASYGGNFDLRPVNDISLGIFRHDIPALFATHTSHLQISDFDVSLDPSLPDFFSNIIRCENFDHLLIDGMEDQTPGNRGNGRKPAVFLKNGKDALIRNVSRERQTSGLVYRENVSGFLYF